MLRAIAAQILHVDIANINWHADSVSSNDRVYKFDDETKVSWQKCSADENLAS